MTPDELERATSKLLSQPIPIGPSDELTAATINALKATPQQEAKAQPQSRTFRRSKVMKIIGYSSLVTAASVAIVFGVVFFGTPHRSAASDFEIAMDNAAKAKTMKYEDISTVEDDNGITEKLHRRTYITEKAIRTEILEVAEPGKPDPNPPKVLAAYVCQFESKKAIAIDYKKKTYRPTRVGTQEMMLLTNKKMIDEFREMKANAKDAKAEKDEVINGKTFNVYTITLKKLFGFPLDEPARIWIDPQKNLPVKILRVKTNKPIDQENKNEPVKVVEDPNATKRITRRNIFDNIVFDSEMDEELFSLTPKGFQEAKE